MYHQQPNILLAALSEKSCCDDDTPLICLDDLKRLGMSHFTNTGLETCISIRSKYYNIRLELVFSSNQTAAL